MRQDLWFKESGEVVDIGTILPIVASATSGRSFMALLRDSPLRDVDKGEQWGKELMRRALSTETLPRGHKRAGVLRPVVDAARRLMMAREAGYLRSLDGYVLDPETGDLRPK